MTPPVAVVFDLGKVLLDFDYDIAVARIQRQCALTLPELQSLINQSPLLHRYETNLISTSQFFAEIQRAAAFSGTLQEFREMFGDIFTPIEPMIALHRELRSRGVPTYIFSNTNEIAIDHVRRRFAFFHNFDGYILSYEHNAMKPDPKLYEVVERITGRSGSNLLYIDDRAENIRAAIDRSWHGIFHHNPTDTRQEVKNAGLI